MKRFHVILLTLVLAFSLAVPAFAAGDSGEPIVVNGTSYPVHYTTSSGTYNLVDWYNDNKDSKPDLAIVVYKGSGGLTMRRYHTGAVVKDGKITPAATGSVDYFELSADGSTWNFESTVNVTPSSYDYCHEVYLSSTTLYDGDNNVVTSAHARFLKALPVIVLEVTEEQMKETLPALGGTMKVLVPCGVGLMALLVVLKLFGKRSLIFLRR